MTDPLTDRINRLCAAVQSIDDPAMREAAWEDALDALWRGWVTGRIVTREQQRPPEPLLRKLRALSRQLAESPDSYRVDLSRETTEAMLTFILGQETRT